MRFPAFTRRTQLRKRNRFPKRHDWILLFVVAVVMGAVLFGLKRGWFDRAPARPPHSVASAVDARTPKKETTRAGRPAPGKTPDYPPYIKALFPPGSNP